MSDLVNSDGVLHPILTRVKKDHTLMLTIRENFINIYYRGGNILNLKEHNKGFYQASFDDQYNKSGLLIPDSPTEINHQNDSRSWIDSFPIRKNIMDEYFSTHGKAEREFQQLIARENNNSTISNESEYLLRISKLLNRIPDLILWLSAGWQLSEKTVVTVKPL